MILNVEWKFFTLCHSCHCSCHIIARHFLFCFCHMKKATSMDTYILKRAGFTQFLDQMRDLLEWFFHIKKDRRINKLHRASDNVSSLEDFTTNDKLMNTTIIVTPKLGFREYFPRNASHHKIGDWQTSLGLIRVFFKKMKIKHTYIPWNHFSKTQTHSFCIW